MIIAPVVRGYLCVTAHPDGCAQSVKTQVGYTEQQALFAGPKTALVLGCSNGLGLAARIAVAFGAGAQTVGVCLERPATSRRPATPGWYNTVAFEEEAALRGLGAWTVVGDAYSDEVKQETAGLIRRQLGTVDLIVYSLAAPRRKHPETGTIHASVLKTIGQPFTGDSYEFSSRTVRKLTLPPATDQEIRDTVAVMGGDDWSRWLRVLRAEGALAVGARSIAFSYVGQPSLAPTYRAGTMGRAKDHLESTAQQLSAEHADLGLDARIAVMKALVTQSSAAIPMSTLYTIVLGAVMRERGLDEDAIAQCCRLFADRLYGGEPLSVDGSGRIRLDDLELRPDVQAEVDRRLATVTTENLHDIGDPNRFERDLLQLYGFDWAGVDYSADCDPVRPIRSVAADG